MTLCSKHLNQLPKLRVFPKMMNSNDASFVTWRNIPQALQDTVFGWIRINHNSDQIIPTDIKQLCLAFYFMIEYLTEHGDHLIINDRLDIVGNTEYIWNTVYGNISITNQDPSIKYIYKWSIKILEIRSEISIGLDVSNKKYINSDFAKKDGHYFYQFTTKGQCYINSPDHMMTYWNKSETATNIYLALGGKYHNDSESNNGTFFEGDTMDMIYNTRKREIEIIKNENYTVGILSNVEIPKNCCYFAITLGAEGDRVKLTDFTQTQLK